MVITGWARDYRVTLKIGTRKWEMRNGKWGNGSKLLTFCFCSHQGKVDVHGCTHCWEIIFAWKLARKGYATALHHSLQANSMYKFFTFGSLLATSWNLLNLWIVHTLFQLDTRSHFEASSCSCLQCYGYKYICLTYRTIIKTACTISGVARMSKLRRHTMGTLSVCVTCIC